MYYAARMFELTLEVSQKKWPAAALLRKNWEDNFPAIVAFAEEIGARVDKRAPLLEPVTSVRGLRLLFKDLG